MNDGSQENSSRYVSISVADSTSPILELEARETTEQSMENTLGGTGFPTEEGDWVSRNSNMTEGTVEVTNEEPPSKKPKKQDRKKRAACWNVFCEVKDKDGNVKLECKFCKKSYVKTRTNPTTHLNNHMDSCEKYKNFLEGQGSDADRKLQQTQLGFVTTNDPAFIPATQGGKVDMELMKESIAHWILINEKRFAIVEEEGFNMLMRRGILEWKSISRNTARNLCVKVYEEEKVELKSLLKKVSKVSITTDLWKSKSQKIEYMVMTGHWIDHNWKLQKRILNFVHLPPPRRGVDIANALWRCLEEWGIESKVHTVSVDNASANDSAITNLKVFIQRKKKLLCNGKLFHVRCCARILNLVAQDGLDIIKDVINVVCDSVEYIRRSDSRLKMFSEIVKQLNLPDRKLVDDCRTRWNSTYEMLAAALKFKDVFPLFADRDKNYEDCPTEEDWLNIDKVCSVLEVFWTATHVISGSDYPTANLFLTEVTRVKAVLENKSNDSDAFVRDMVSIMKLKFDKYWGETNLLMSIAAVLDPRCKEKALEFCFPKLYAPEDVNKKIAHVKEVLASLYDEYLEVHAEQTESRSRKEAHVRDSSRVAVQGSSSSGWSEYEEYLKKVQSVKPQKSELDMYLDEICYKVEQDAKNSQKIDVLLWWKVYGMKYKVLSALAIDILAIPITTVASEAAFSAGTRVIDSYCSLLTAETIQALMCGGDWLRKRFGITKKTKIEKKAMHVTLPVGDNS